MDDWNACWSLLSSLDHMRTVRTREIDTLT